MQYPVTFLDPSAPEIPDFITEDVDVILPLLGKYPADRLLDAIFSQKDVTSDPRVFILKAQTGAGKSTAFVHWAYIWSKLRGKSVTAAEPRIVLCQRLTDSLDEIYPDMVKGANVGYVTGEDKVRPTMRPNLTYVTHQIVNFMMDSPERTNFNTGVVVIDEVHEGSLQLSFLIKKVNEYIKLWGDNSPMFVLASATLDEHLLMNFFGLNPRSALSMLYIGGKPTYTIDDIYITNGKITLQDGTEISVNEQTRFAIASKLTKHIWDHRDRYRDVLMFYTGNDEFIAYKGMSIKNQLKYITANVANKALDDGTSLSNPTLIEAAARTIRTNEEMARAMRRSNLADGEQRHYMSTTLLESGETIPTLEIVIDAGWKNVPVANFLTFQNTLLKLPVSQSASTQRRGRVGRKFAGTAIHLYSKKAYDTLPIEDFSATLMDIGLAEFFRTEYMDLIRKNSDTVGQNRITKFIPSTELPQFDIANHNLPTQITLEGMFGIYRQLRRFMMLNNDGKATQFMIMTDRWDEMTLSHKPFLYEFIKAAGTSVGSDFDSVFLVYAFKNYIRNGVFESPNSSMIMRNRDLEKVYKSGDDFIKSAVEFNPLDEHTFDSLKYNDDVHEIIEAYTTSSMRNKCDNVGFANAITRVSSILRLVASGLQPLTEKSESRGGRGGRGGRGRGRGRGR